jgi:hypothetical protein
MKGSLKIQASGGRSLLRPMSAMSTPLIEMDMAVQSFSVCFVFHFFLNLVRMAKDRWWQEWTPQKVDAAWKLISNLELQLLGSLFVLGNRYTQYIVSTQTNISEEVHRKFFLTWTANMASIKDKFTFMPSDDKTFNKVVGEYTNRGLPGCVGSIDCVHIAWDKCPTSEGAFCKLFFHMLCVTG